MRTVRRRSVVGSCLADTAVALGGLVLGGCASARNDLGTRSSGCYVALPAALNAVHHQGHLSGVVLTSVSSLKQRAPLLYRAATAHQPFDRQVCLVAFTGQFSSAEVADPVGAPTGGLAVVELGYPGHRLVATLVTDHSSLDFGHSHTLPL